MNFLLYTYKYFKKDDFSGIFFLMGNGKMAVFKVYVYIKFLKVINGNTSES